MNTNGYNTKEEQIIELYIKEHMTLTEYYLTYSKVKKSTTNMKKIRHFKDITGAFQFNK